MITSEGSSFSAASGHEPGPFQIRRDRDRFAAFSFCGADLLMELDDSETVVFATGAVEALLQLTETDLVGRPLAEIATAEYAGLVTAILAGARAQDRINATAIRLNGSTRPTPPMQTAGYYLPSLAGLGHRYYLAMRLDPGRIGPTGNRTPETGLLDVDGFSDDVARYLGQDLEVDLKVTLVHVGNLEHLRSKLDVETRATMMEIIGASLRAGSVGGDTAGQFDTDRFGLLRDSRRSIAPIWRQLRELTRSIDPDRVGLDIADADLDPTAIGLTGGRLPHCDVLRVLTDAINDFDAEAATTMSLDTLAREIGSAAQAATERIGYLRSAVAEGAFAPAFRPIVDAATGRPHHFEVLARFPSDAESSADEEIRLSDDVDLMTEFALKMTDKVIEWLRATNRFGMRYHIAIALSGRTLASRDFISSLLAKLEQASDVRTQIMFELTETSRIPSSADASALIDQLRRLGHLICLDDFGADEMGFNCLRAFDVDIVKLNGGLVHEALTGPKGKAFLKGTIAMCTELGIATVAEAMGNERSLEALRDLGVRLAQGDLFGTPSTDISVFQAPRLSCFEGHRWHHTS